MLDDFAQRVDLGAAVGEHHALGKTRGAGGVVDGRCRRFRPSIGDRDRRGGRGREEAPRNRRRCAGPGGLDEREQLAGRPDTTLAPQCFRIQSSSSEASRVLSITRTAPISMGPKWASSAAAAFMASTATRSPGATPSGLQRGRELPDPGLELAIGEAPAGIHHGKGIGINGGRAGQKIQGCQRGDHGMVPRLIVQRNPAANQPHLNSCRHANPPVCNHLWHSDTI